MPSLRSYPPQFYRLHVHFTALSVAIGAGHFVERAHLLDDVIENLERDGEHYARASITVRLGEGDALQQRYVAAAAAALGEGGAKKARLAED
jgi:m7GpppX diphosphatase